MFNYLLLEQKGKVAYITINKPERLNALDTKIIAELSTVLDVVSQDKHVKVVVFTGAGDKAFVAGADIKEFVNFTPEQGEKLAREGQAKLFDKIANLGKPSIAMINGFALGGGLELALACDIRLACDTAKLGLPEVTLGLIPGYGGTQRLANLVGKSQAKKMIFSGEMIGGVFAERIGLINQVFPVMELEEATEKLANKIANNSYKAIQKAMFCIENSNKIEGYEFEIKSFGSLFQTTDFIEGTSAFLEKRKPNFE